MTTNARTIIIAEAGVNHNGELDLAKKLVDQAFWAGADYVKFQTFKAESLVSKNAKMAEYQVKNLGTEESQYAMIKKLELSEDDHHILKAYCEKIGIKFLSTGFDLESLDFLNDVMNLDLFKIPSGELTNYPYLCRVASYKKPVVLSTGMASKLEIEWALDVLKKKGVPLSQITVLHCTTEYPAPFDEINLRAMVQIQKDFDVAVGYSDHTVGIEVPISAVAMGAQIIEKHFTLDKNMVGPDHKASLEPHELKAMVSAIRNIEKALGKPIKEPTPSEIKNKEVARKSIVAKIKIKKGEVFSEINLTTKRPGSGISPMKWEELIGKIASRDYEMDELLQESEIL